MTKKHKPSKSNSHSDRKLTVGFKSKKAVKEVFTSLIKPWKRSNKSCCWSIGVSNRLWNSRNFYWTLDYEASGGITGGNTPDPHCPGASRTQHQDRGHICAHWSLKHTLRISLVTQSEGLADAMCVPLNSLQFISQQFDKRHKDDEY